MRQFIFSFSARPRRSSHWAPRFRQLHRAIRSRARPIRSTTITASASPIPIAGWRTTIRRRPRPGSRRRTKSRSAISNKFPQRDAIRQRLTKLWNYERYGVPFKEGGRYFFSQERRPAKSKRALHVALARRASRACCSIRTSFPPTARSRWPVSRSATTASCMAYGLSGAGSDWQEWRVRDVRTGQGFDRRPANG